MPATSGGEQSTITVIATSRRGGTLNRGHKSSLRSLNSSTPPKKPQATRGNPAQKSACPPPPSGPNQTTPATPATMMAAKTGMLSRRTARTYTMLATISKKSDQTGGLKLKIAGVAKPR